MQKFDYIIVGAGSAGCVLAHRLSADPYNQVLLLEAGPADRNPFIHMPGGYGQLFRTAIDWSYWSEPQEHVNGKRMFLPRGKTWGGSSSTNAMAYVRGNRADYDAWAQMGNTGWDYDSVLPYFKRSENHAQFDQLDPRYHNDAGELHVTAERLFESPYSRAFIESGKAMGIPETPDYNGAEQAGIGYLHFTIHQGKRHSSAQAFLKPALKRPNLKILSGIQVLRVLLSSDRATGVEVLKGKSVMEALYAEKEVILSAGAFNSPQLLMLSGIGEADELKSQGIELRHELPGVGKNLQDHLFYLIGCESNQEKGLNHYLKPQYKIQSLGNYLLRKKGPLTTSPLEAFAFLNLDDHPSGVDFQLHFTPSNVGRGYDYDVYSTQTYPRKDGYMVLPSLIHPKSRGYLRLRSDNPLDAPRIQPNFLSEEEDLKKLLKGGKLAMELLNQSPFDPYRKARVAPLDWNSDDALAEHIRRSLETVYHPVGTCKMGQDEASVVDSQLRVHGIEGLRVVDASVMPQIPSGNTNAPVYMIAEKASDMIRGIQLSSSRSFLESK